MSMDNLIAPKSSRKKFKNFENNVKTYLESKEYDETIKLNESKSDEEYERFKADNLIQESYETKRNSRQRNLIKRDKELEGVLSECIPVLFSSLVYRSLPLDEDFKKHNVKYIYESSSNLFKELVTVKAIKFDRKNPNVFSEMCEEIAVALTNDNPDEVDLPKVINHALNANPEATDAITKAVSGKTIDAVADEKKVITFKEKQKEENKYVTEDKSLFRYLNENNVRRVVKENPELSKDDVMDLAMSETILDYTMLETINTCNIIDFDLTKVNTVKKFISD